MSVLLTLWPAGLEATLSPAETASEAPRPQALEGGEDEQGIADGISDAEEHGRIQVAVGAQVIIDDPGVMRVSVADPEVADVHVVEGREILITGVSHGRTSLNVWYRDDEEVRSYIVEVTDETRLAEILEALEVLSLDRVIEARAVGRRIVIDGRIQTLAQLERYTRLVENWPELVDLVRVETRVLEEIAALVQEALVAAGIETVEVRVVGGTVFLEGSVADEEELKLVEAITRAIHDSVDPSRLRPP